MQNMQFNPMWPFMFGGNNNFPNQQLNVGGNNNWMGSYTGIMTPKQIQNINNSYNPFNQDTKMNILFRTSNGKIFNILFDREKTVEELIQTFFRRVDQENLFQQGQEGGITFVHNALPFDYHVKAKVKEFFKVNTTPTIMVLDVNNLIGA